jgi:hypothetical protein
MGRWNRQVTAVRTFAAVLDDGGSDVVPGSRLFVLTSVKVRLAHVWAGVVAGVRVIALSVTGCVSKRTMLCCRELLVLLARSGVGGVGGRRVA